MYIKFKEFKKFAEIKIIYTFELTMKHVRQVLPTLTHECPICGRSDLRLLFEHNLIMKVHEQVCANEEYAHVEYNGTHYFVRRTANIMNEMEDSKKVLTEF